MAWLVWDPNPDFITLPFIDRSIKWYGLLFVVGFIFGYFLIARSFKTTLTNYGFTEKEARYKGMQLSDKLITYVLVGGILGARIGHILFYDFPYYQQHPFEIFKVWEGGLASHGGILGGFLTLLLYYRKVKKEYPFINLIYLLDIIAVPGALVGFFIRMGNFFNQEILGPATDVPWAIIFGHAADGLPPVPRHPSQLYEALAYLAFFFILSFLKNRREWKPGFLSGTFLLLVFGFRFIIEFLKCRQCTFLDESFLQMGQYLSIPFILSGLLLLLFSFYASTTPALTQKGCCIKKPQSPC